LREVRDELRLALGQNDKIKDEKDKLAEQLRAARDELENIHSDFEQFKQSASNEQKHFIDQKEQVLNDHYQRSIQVQLQQVFV